MGLLRLSNGFIWVDHTQEDKSLSVFNWYCFNLDTMKQKISKAGEETQSAVIPLKGSKNRKATRFSGLHSRMTWTSNYYQGSNFVLFNKIIILWSGVQCTTAIKTWAVKRLWAVCQLLLTLALWEEWFRWVLLVLLHYDLLCTRPLFWLLLLAL